MKNNSFEEKYNTLYSHIKNSPIHEKENKLKEILSTIAEEYKKSQLEAEEFGDYTTGLMMLFAKVGNPIKKYYFSKIFEISEQLELHTQLRSYNINPK